MDLETATFELKTALKEAGVVFDGNLRLVSTGNNISFSDYKSVFVKVLSSYEDNPKFLIQEHYLTFTHSKIMKPLTKSPLKLYLSSGEILWVTVWNYVSHIIRSPESLFKEDGKLIGKELLDFYSKTPLSPLALTSGWATKKSMDNLSSLDVPSDIAVTLNYLADVAMFDLEQNLSAKNVQDLVLVHGDPHVQNVLWLNENTVRLIDFESIKYEYVECDLACFYQSLVQINNRIDVFDALLEKVKSVYSVDLTVLEAYVRARNVTAISFMCRSQNWDIVRSNLVNVQNSFYDDKNVVSKLYLP
jgi:hypothetical protein